MNGYRITDAQISAAETIEIYRRAAGQDWDFVGISGARTRRGLAAAMTRARIVAQPEVRAYLLLLSARDGVAIYDCYEIHGYDAHGKREW